MFSIYPQEALNTVIILDCVVRMTCLVVGTGSAPGTVNIVPLTVPSGLGGTPRFDLSSLPAYLWLSAFTLLVVLGLDEISTNMKGIHGNCAIRYAVYLYTVTIP